jgi:1-deoxy-D-xylulose-5-phosphate reductoisomerase
LNAANEEAVQAFLDERISLTDIPKVIEEVLDAHHIKALDNLDTVLAADSSARVHAASVVARLAQTANEVVGDCTPLAS